MASNPSHGDEVAQNDTPARAPDTIDIDRDCDTDVLDQPAGAFVPISGWAPTNAGVGPSPMNIGMEPAMGGAVASGMPLVYGLNVPFGSDDQRDGRIADAAETALAREPRLSTLAAEHIIVQAAYGVVELTGTVPTEADREIAEEVVAHLPGVSAVENRLSVASH